MTDPEPELDNWFLVDLLLQRLRAELEGSFLVRLLQGVSAHAAHHHRP